MKAFRNMGWSTSALTRTLVLLVAAQVLAAAVESPAAAYLAKNNDKFKQMLNAVSVDDKALNAMHGVLLLPSNAAIDALASSMGMTTQQLLANKLLVDQITAYHFLPKLSIKKGAKIPNTAIITNTAEQHYVVRYMKDPATNKAWLVDMQGNKVHLKQQPVELGKLTVVPIDKVLMSGGYYKSVEDALKLHAQLGKASEVAQKAGGLASTAAAAPGGSRTLFVPVDKAFDTSKVSVSAMSAPDSRRVLQYHTLPTAVPAGQLGSGSKATLLSGHDVRVEAKSSGELKAPWTAKAVPKPVITVTDESGNKADITLYNIWAGNDVIHGISRVLTPKAAAISTEKAPAQVATSSTGSTSKAGSNRRLLGLAADQVVGQGRRLLQSQFGPDWSQQRNPASALLAQNTVGAAYTASNNLQTAYFASPDAPGWDPRDYWSDWETNA